MAEEIVKKRRGRPPGSKNKPKVKDTADTPKAVNVGIPVVKNLTGSKTLLDVSSGGHTYLLRVVNYVYYFNIDDSLELETDNFVKVVECLINAKIANDVIDISKLDSVVNELKELIRSVQSI